jgi:threonine dehydrogenase-like Zn-dependent dehydrogenase
VKLPRKDVNAFKAQEIDRDGSLRWADYAYMGSEETRYRIERQGKVWLDLPDGYRLLKTLRCGICSTDQARPHLPFPLPQVIGHEVLAHDHAGCLVAAEINASHAALGSPEAGQCAYCRGHLPSHCPDRLTLGIDRLPGGFAPFILVPKHNIVPVPAKMSADTAILVEPFAAALHAVETLEPNQGNLQRADIVAVVGTGRLGLLVVAALHAMREIARLSYSIAALEPNPLRRDRARRLGADLLWPGDQTDSGQAGVSADVAVEATGSSEGLKTALGMARAEVHVKSTTGREALGMRHLTAMVVDEVSLAPFSRREVESLAGRGRRSAYVLDDAVSRDAERTLAAAGLEVRRLDPEKLPADHDPADIALVASLQSADTALRPWPGCERSLVWPRGTILVEEKPGASGMLEPLFAKNLRITTSRCGEFKKAFPVMERLLARGIDLGELLITHRLPASDLEAAMQTARSPEAVKVIVEHPHNLL